MASPNAQRIAVLEEFTKALMAAQCWACSLAVQALRSPAERDASSFWLKTLFSVDALRRAMPSIVETFSPAMQAFLKDAKAPLDYATEARLVSHSCALMQIEFARLIDPSLPELPIRATVEPS